MERKKNKQKDRKKEIERKIERKRERRKEERQKGVVGTRGFRGFAHLAGFTSHMVAVPFPEQDVRSIAIAIPP